MSIDPSILSQLQNASPEEAAALMGSMVQNAATPKPNTDAYSSALSEFQSMPAQPPTMQGALSGFGDAITAGATAGLASEGIQVDTGTGIPGLGAVSDVVGSAGQITAGAVATGDKGYVIAPSGNILFNNGVIVTPDGSVIGGPWESDPSVAGSVAWLDRIRSSWSEKKLNDWRERLSNAGFEVARTGGWGPDLKTALRNYHMERYANFGDPPKALPEISKKEIRNAIDFVALKQEAKPLGELPFGGDLDDDSAEYIADMVVSLTQHLMKTKGWSFDQALSGAKVRAENQFFKQPEVKAGLEEAERIEERTGLRQRLEAAANVFGQI